jgi:predicted HTH transcriptional regulator
LYLDQWLGQATFRKDIFGEQRVIRMGLNDGQVRALQYVKEHDRITNREYQRIAGISGRAALRDLNELRGRGLLERRGSTGRGTEYIPTRQRPADPVTNPPRTRRAPHPRKARKG